LEGRGGGVRRWKEGEVEMGVEGSAGRGGRVVGGRRGGV